MLGIVKKKIMDKGFGFISPENGGEDLFFHFSALEGGLPSFEGIEVGEKVEFEVINGRRPGSKQASNVSFTGDSGYTLEEQTPEAPRLSPIEIIIRTSMKAIAAEIARNPDCLQEVEWRDLERSLREVLEGLGFATELTRSGKDGGFDLKLECEKSGEIITYLIEVKHWVKRNKKPGKAVVTAFADVVVSAAGNTGGLILSSSGFTKEVLNGQTVVKQVNIHLGGRSKIVSLYCNYMKLAEGLWCPTTELGDVLLEETHCINQYYSAEAAHFTGK